MNNLMTCIALSLHFFGIFPWIYMQIFNNILIFDNLGKDGVYFSIF